MWASVIPPDSAVTTFSHPDSRNGFGHAHGGFRWAKSNQAGPLGVLNHPHRFGLQLDRISFLRICSHSSNLPSHWGHRTCRGLNFVFLLLVLQETLRFPKVFAIFPGDPHLAGQLSRYVRETPCDMAPAWSTSFHRVQVPYTSGINQSWGSPVLYQPSR